MREGTPVTGKYKTQRSCTVVKQPGSSSRHSSEQFCIPVTNRFESLSVVDEKTTGIQAENSNKDVTPNHSHSKKETSEFESSNSIESQSVITSVTNLLNNLTKLCKNT